ncbi:DUF2157 domain-containing protein [Leucothrix sargassi]|nr:DUF2157 domain-containing protein [Leucothrix sargassi]
MKKTNRQLLLEWAGQSSIDRDQLMQSLKVGEVLPSVADWRDFLDKFLLYVGGLLMMSGVVFFFAYNWDDLSRMMQFALVQGAIVLSLGAFWWLGLEKLSGKLSLMAAAISVGVLLALIGQTYQTGADTYELFAAWCALILPWALLARFDVLWMFWLLLLNLSITLYYQVFGGLFHLLFGGNQMVWVLFVVNTVALLIWEWVVRNGSERRKIRWMTRLLATVSCGFITTLAILAIIAFDSAFADMLGVVVWVVWLACAYHWYCKVLLDVYVLAIGVLSTIAVVSVFLGRILFGGDMDAIPSLLFMGLVVIGLSAAGAFWLRGVVVGDDE